MSADTSSIIAGEVSIRLTHEPDEEAEYGEITSVRAKIFVKTQEKAVGSIEAIIVDRQRVPECHFYSAFDCHSASLQAIGCALLEPRYGRTKLTSLAEWDDPEFDFMIIDKFHVDDAYKLSGSSSDVAAKALHQFLHHPFISGSLPDGLWKVSSVAYELDPKEAMSPEERQQFQKFERGSREYDRAAMCGQASSKDAKALAHEAEGRRWKERMDELGRVDAIPFLRNGFFQDPSLAKAGGMTNILVAGYGQFCEPLKSDAQVAAIQFVTESDLFATEATPSGKDAELFELVKKACVSAGVKYDGDVPLGDLANFRTQAQQLLQSGASVARSHGLHVASQNNTFNLVSLLLDLEPAAVNGFDVYNSTPLMHAAMSAAGRSTRSGIPEARVIDLLVARGANKSLQDPRRGLTAYGRFLAARKEYATMMQAMTGGAVQSLAPTPSEQAVMDKLLPSDGPSPADLTGGLKEGFIDYTSTDQENMDMMGGSSDDDEDW